MKRKTRWWMGLGWTVCLAWCWVEVGRADSGVRESAELSPISIYGQVVDARGEPVSQAVAWLEPLPSQLQQLTELLPGGSPLEPWLQVPADGQGRFTLLAPEHGLYAVRVEAPGFLPMELTLEPLLFDRRLPTAVLALDEGMGVNVRTADGAPGKGARLVVYPEDRGPRGRVQTRAQDSGWQPAVRRLRIGQDGTARLPYASGERLWAYAVLPGHPVWAGHVDSGAETFRVELEPTGDTQLVTVRWGPRPLASALLVFDSVPVGRTDKSGRVALRSVDLRKRLKLMTADGGHEIVTVGTEGSRISVESGGRRGGWVTDHFRRFPIPDALIWSPMDRHAVRADANGRFRWPAQRSEGPLRVAAPGFFPSDVQGVDGFHGLLKMTMEPSAEVSGTVVTEDGDPMAGVPMAARLRGRGKSPGAELRWETVSKPDGSFHFAGLPGSRDVEVWARPDGWVPARRMVRTPLLEEKTRRAEPVELILNRGHSVTGRVVDGDSRPIPGVVVQIYSQPAAGHATTAVDDEGRSAKVTTTDVEGRFVIQHVPAGRHWVRLSASGWAPRIVSGVFLSGGSRDLDDLVLETGQTLSLDLESDDGGAVSGADVELQWGLEPSQATESSGEIWQRITRRQASSDSHGRVRVENLPVGRLAVTVSHPDFLALRQDVTLPSEPVVLVLSPASRLSGRVVDAEGKGLSSLKIRAETLAQGSDTDSSHGNPVAQMGAAVTHRAETKTVSRGYFELAGVQPGRVHLTVSRNRFELTRLELDLEAGVEPDPLHFVVDRGVDIQGRVVDFRGRVVRRGEVFMVYREVPDQTYRTRIDSRGSFRFHQAPLGVVDVWTEGPDQGRAEAQIRLTSDQDPAVLELAMERTWEGQVVDAAGRGVAGARVHVSLPRPVHHPPVDSEGRFSISVHGDEAISLTAMGPGTSWVSRHIEMAELSEMERVELVLPQGTRIVGQVRGVPRDELRGVKIEGVHQTPAPGLGSVLRQTRLEKDSAFEMGGFMPGKVRLSVQVEGSLQRTSRVVEIPPGVHEVSVDLDLGEPDHWVLTGQIFHNGEPVPNALVLPGKVLTDTEGRFRMNEVEAGNMTLTVLGPWGRHHHPLEMRGDREVEVYIETHKILGLVRDGAGRPLAGVTVECRLDGAEDVSVQDVTDTAGWFEFHELQSGSYRFSFSRPGYGSGYRDLVLDADLVGLTLTLQAER